MSRRWTQLPLRTCHTQHTCALRDVVGRCNGIIHFGETYRDGGHGKRAHERCVRIAAGDEALPQQRRVSARATQATPLANVSSAPAASLFGARVSRTRQGVN